MTLLKLDHAGFHSQNGGNLHVIKGLSPSPLRLEGWGIGFGPLRIAPWANSTVVINELAFESAKNDSLFSFFTGALGTSTAATGGFAAALVAGTATEDDDGIDPMDRGLTRRSFIAAAGTFALLAGTATAQSDDELYNVAQFELETSPRGIQIRVDDVVADYLPPDQTFYVEIDGTHVGSFNAADGSSLTINPGIEGHVVISSDSAISFIDRVLARFTTKDELHYSFNPVESAFSSYTVGDVVTISDQPILIDPINQADRKETVLQINGEKIPHADDKQGPLGYWYVRDGTALVYVVGEDAPESTLVDVWVNVGTVDRIKQRL